MQYKTTLLYACNIHYNIIHIINWSELMIFIDSDDKQYALFKNLEYYCQTKEFFTNVPRLFLL